MVRQAAFTALGCTYRLTPHPAPCPPAPSDSTHPLWRLRRPDATAAATFHIHLTDPSVGES